MVVARSVRFPLQGARVRATGEIVIKAVVPLMIRTHHGRFKPVDFLVDTGASITSMTVKTAERLRLLIPGKQTEIEVQTAIGRTMQRRHPGHIMVRVPGLEETPFLWPCHFVEIEGDSPISALGLAGVLNDLKITLDGRYTFEAPYGWLILERQQ